MFETSVSHDRPVSLTRLRSFVSLVPRLILTGLFASLLALAGNAEGSSITHEKRSNVAYDVQFEHLPDQIQAGERVEVTVITTRNGERVKTPVHLFADEGEFDNGGRFREDWAVTGSDGQVTITYRAPEDKGSEYDRVRAKIPATPSGHVDTSAKIQIQETIEATVVDIGGGDRIEPGEVVQLKMKVVADGSPLTNVPLKLHLEEPAGGDHPDDEAPRGQLERQRVVTDAQGRATVTYHAPDVRTTSGLVMEIQSDREGGGYHDIPVRP